MYKTAGKQSTTKTYCWVHRLLLNEADIIRIDLVWRHRRYNMTTSRHRNTFRITCSLWETWWIPVTKSPGMIRYNCDVIMSTMASQVTSLTIVYSTVYSGAGQRKHQSSASLAFVRGINRWSVSSPHKWTGTRKKFPFDDVIMHWCFFTRCYAE